MYIEYLEYIEYIVLPREIELNLYRVDLSVS